MSLTPYRRLSSLQKGLKRRTSSASSGLSHIKKHGGKAKSGEHEVENENQYRTGEEVFLQLKKDYTYVRAKRAPLAEAGCRGGRRVETPRPTNERHRQKRVAGVVVGVDPPPVKKTFARGPQSSLAHALR